MPVNTVDDHRDRRSLQRITPLIGRFANCSFLSGLMLVIILLGLGPGKAFSQDTRVPQIQLGFGILPGVGAQAGYILPRGFYTMEGVLYVDGSPPFAGGEGTMQVAGGVGGAVRILGILRAVGSPGYVGRNFDVGLRFGPSLFFAFGEETSREENPFSLFLEPFLRATSDFGGDRILFAELGIQRPFLRAGLWLSL